MRPVEVLEQEHRVIEQVLNCLEKMVGVASRDGRIDAPPARDAVEFLRTFADRCHHGKEEERLFPMMEASGFSAEQGPTAVMRHEHVLGREFIGRMDRSVDGASNGEAEDVREFVTSAASYVDLLRQHIQKEDHCLFPMADQALTSEQQHDLAAGFEKVDREEIGVEAHARCLRIADELAERYGIPRARAGHSS